MIGNGIRHTTTSVGSGPITLAGVTGHPGYQHVFGATGGRMVAYSIQADDGGQPGPFIESGIGDLDFATMVLTRYPRATWDGTTYSADLPAPILLTAGTKHVTCAPTAEMGAYPGLGNLGDGIGAGADNAVSNSATNTLTNGRRVFSHVFLRHPRTIGALAVRLGGAYTGGSFSLSYALYELNQNGIPYRRITPLLTRSGFTAGTIQETVAPRVYAPAGDYALGFVADFAGGSGTPTILATSVALRASPFGTHMANDPRTMQCLNGGTGALPADASGLSFSTLFDRAIQLVVA